jgi:DNA primase
MTQRPYVSFQEIKKKVPIPDVLEVLGIADQFRRKGDSLTGVCPLPSHQHGPSPNPEQFKINRKEDGLWLWKCFGDCDKGGDVIEFVKQMAGLDNAHVRFWFAEHFFDRLDLTKRRDRREEATNTFDRPAAEAVSNTEQPASETPPEENVADNEAENPDTDEPLKPLRFTLRLKTDVPYLRERGLTDDTISRFGLGLCNRGLLKGYVAIPVYDYPHEEGANPVAYLLKVKTPSR